MANPTLLNTLWFSLLMSAFISTSASASASGSSNSLATSPHPPRRRLRAQQRELTKVSYPPGMSGDAVNILVVRPGCEVTYMGINFETGRTGYRIDCPDEDDDDDFVALPGGTDDDDDYTPPQVEDDDDDYTPPPVEDNDDAGAIPPPVEDDDDGGAAPVEDDDGMALLDDDDATGTFLDDEIIGTDDDDGGAPPPAETDDNAVPAEENDDGGNALPPQTDDGMAPLDDDGGTGTFLDDAILAEDDDDTTDSQGGSGGVGFFPDPAQDDDDKVIAGAENEIIAQEDRNGLGQAAMAMVCFAILGLLFLICCCAYKKKQVKGALNESDAERLLGGDVEEAYSSPSPYKDEDGYQPPIQDRGYATKANGKQRRMAGTWGGLEELEDEDQWEGYVQSLREYKSQQGDCLVSLFYRDDRDRPLGQWVTLQRHLRRAGELPQDKIDQLTALGFVWELQRGDGSPEEHGIVTDPTVWDQYLQSLAVYRELHGDCNVPFDYRDSEGRALGKWVHRQRNRASRGSLSMAQQRQLDELGFDWDGNISRRGSISGVAGDAGLFDLEDDKLWNEYFQCVKNYKAEHGDCLVPSHYRDPEDRPLGQWVTLQRHLAGAKELSQDKIDKLTAIGFVWELQDGDGTPEEHGIVTDSTVWGEHMESLKVYKRTYGDCDVPYFYVDSDGRSLGKWAHRQRHRAKRGSLSRSQKAQLDALGFDWNVLGRRSSIGLGSLGYADMEDDSLWDEYVDSLTEYKAEKGDCIVPSNHRDSKSRPLGQWVTLQRHLAAADELSQEKMDQLDTLGFVWDLQEGDGTAEDHGIVTDPIVWEQHLASLGNYKKQYGDCDVPYSYRDDEGRALGKWVNHQRHRANRGTLSEPQEEQLASLGFNLSDPSNAASESLRGLALEEESNLMSAASVKSVGTSTRGSLLKRMFSSKKTMNESIRSQSAADSHVSSKMKASNSIRSQSAADGSSPPLGRNIAAGAAGVAGAAALLSSISIATGGSNPSHDLEDDSLWSQYVQSLVDYKFEHGDCLVPYTFRDSERRPLGQWVTLQRHFAAAGDLDQEKIDELDALGFVWELQYGDGTAEEYGIVSDPKVWDQYLGALANYKEDTGDCDVPYSFRNDDGRVLGRWVHRQRHRAKRGTLSQSQEEQLDALGFDWEIPSDGGLERDLFLDENDDVSLLKDGGASVLGASVLNEPSVKSASTRGSLLKRMFSSKKTMNDSIRSQSVAESEALLSNRNIASGDMSSKANRSNSIRSQSVADGSSFVNQNIASGDVSSKANMSNSIRSQSAADGSSLLNRNLASGDVSSKGNRSNSIRSQSAAGGSSLVNRSIATGDVHSKAKGSNSIRSQSAADGSSRHSSRNIAAGAAGVAGAAALLSGISLATGGAEQNNDLEDDSLWSQYVQSLVDYKFEHGDCLVPSIFRDSERRPLGQWVTLQRHFAAAGDLDQEKIDELDALGFVWELQYGDGTAEEHGIVSDPTVWNQYLGALANYKAKTGDCDVPYYYTDDDGRALGRWVHRQRHRARRGTLSQSQEEQLDALGFDWEIPSDGGLERDLYLDENDDVSLLKDGGASLLNEPSVKSASTRGSLLKRMFSSKKTTNDSIRSQSVANGSSFVSNHNKAIGAAGVVGAAGVAALLSSRSFGGAQRYQDLEDDSIWEEYVQALTEYKAQHSDCLVPSNYRDANSRQLGQWVTLQRHLAAGGELTQPHIDQLAALGFVWAPQDGDGTAEDHGIVVDPTFWDQYLASLKDFKEENGHCKVPFYHLDSEGRPLGKWVHRQRHRAKRGSIFPDQHKQLSALGFDWDTSLGELSGAYGGVEKFDDLEDDLLWREYVQSLTNYKAKNGDCLVPSRYRDEDGRPLGQWVTLQRHLSAANEMPRDKIDELAALGFVWQLQEVDGTSEDQGIVTDPQVWDQYLASLADYKKENGHCDVPYSYRDNEGRALGYWAQRQRSRKKRGTLSESQKGKLDSLGFNWYYPYSSSSSNSAAVDRSMSVASSAVSSPSKRGSLLKRLFSSKNNMTDKSTVGERSAIAERSAVGDKSATATGNDAVADPHHLFGPEGNDKWEEYVQALKNYQTSHDGDCNVPRAYTDNDSRKLGEWVSAQRVRNACNKLPPEYFDELDALGFVWNLQPDDDKYRMGPILGDVVEDWDSYVASLKKYRKANGDCMVPIDYKDTKNRSLGGWVSNVRDVAAQNELPPPKRDELNQFGFDWESHRGDGYGVMGGCGYGRWEEYFDALVEYKVDHGDCSVPLEYRDGYGLELGAWVANQRHRADQDELPYQNQDRLTGLGFDWETQGQKGGGTPPEAVWGRHMQAILDYTGHYGNPDTVARTFEDWNGVGLGSWLINQSDKALAGKLHPTLKKELKDAGIDLKWFRNGGRDNRSSPKEEKNDATRGPEIYADLLDNFKDDDDTSNDTSVGGNPSHNVHQCTSATCDACKVHGGEEVTFLKTSDIV